ncbi:MAG: phage holin family protein [Candidatus Methylacidiphilales bacterium]
MKHVNYVLSGFGYEKGVSEYLNACAGAFMNSNKVDLKLIIIAIAGVLRMFLHDFVGFDVPVFFAFIFLIIAEVYTGIKVSVKVNKERVKSRPIGRMILKIGTYLVVLLIANVFAKSITAPDVLGISLNPFTWLYYAVFTGIVLQLFISWFENLGCLGYKETKTLAGFILRKFNNWFEFDGSKKNN